MQEFSLKTGIKIDTLDRSYRADKNLIALPDNYDDELYAGAYFPRRYEGRFLSIEYLNFYQDKAPEKMMALVAGIYENKDTADSALKMITNSGQKAVNLKVKMYIGCLH